MEQNIVIAVDHSYEAEQAVRCELRHCVCIKVADLWHRRVKTTYLNVNLNLTQPKLNSPVVCFAGFLLRTATPPLFHPNFGVRIIICRAFASPLQPLYPSVCVCMGTRGRWECLTCDWFPWRHGGVKLHRSVSWAEDFPSAGCGFSSVSASEHRQHFNTATVEAKT